MRYLLDSNCWMQVARNREHADEVRRLLTDIPLERIAITDFALHSLAIIMARFKSIDVFPAFIEQVGIGTAVSIIRLASSDWKRIVEICKTYRLDVDDGYQYAAAEIHRLALVSYDADYDRTPNGRWTPGVAIQQFAQEQAQPKQDP